MPVRMIRHHPWEFVAATVISLVAALVSIHFWNFDLSVPFEYRWDSIFFQAQVKSVLDHGSIYVNPALGAPFSGQLYDWPGGDALTWPLALFLGLFTDSSAVAMNLIWLCSFPLAAGTSWWAMRSLGVPGLPAIVASVLFSILPYHFWRGESHLILSVYYTIPLTGFFIAKVLLGERLFRFRAALDGVPGARKELVMFVLVAALIGFGGPYYVLQAGIVLGIACCLGLLLPDRRPAAWTGLVALGVSLLVLALTLAPSAIFVAKHGKNPATAARSLNETEYYGLSLTQLLLPATNHRFEPASKLKARYLEQTVAPSEDSQSLGFAGAIGLLWIICVAILSVVGNKVFARASERAAGAGALIAILVGTVGGGASLIALLATTQIRAWNRMSVLVGFFALIGFAFLLGRLLDRVARLPRGGFPAGILLAGTVILAAIYDQTPARWPLQYEYSELTRQYRSDQRFVDRLEADLPPDASVFQIPYLKFPEGYPPPGKMFDYDPMKGYLHSRDLHWSYGAMKGRAGDIGACLADFPTKLQARAAAAFGFDAIWVDTDGYTPGEAKRITAEMKVLTGSPGMVSEGGRFRVFNLGGVESDPTWSAGVEAALPTDQNAIQDCGPIEAAVAKPMSTDARTGG